MVQLEQQHKNNDERRVTKRRRDPLFDVRTGTALLLDSQPPQNHTYQKYERLANHLNSGGWGVKIKTILTLQARHRKRRKKKNQLNYILNIDLFP